MAAAAATIYWIVAIWLMGWSSAAGPTLPGSDRCKPDVCHPCFSDEVECNTYDFSDVIPQYLTPNLTSLKVKFTSPDNSTATLKRQDMEKFTRLLRLSLYRDFSSIDHDTLSALPSLISIELGGAKVAELPDNLVANNTNMTYVQLNNNLFTEIPINIFGNSTSYIMKKFIFSKQTNVRLPCVVNRMTLPPAFSQLKRLEELDLGYSTFNTPNCSALISEDFFKPVSSIRDLFLAGTNLINGTEQALKALKHLKILDISSLDPYRQCPSGAQTLFDNLPPALDTLNVYHWEVAAVLPAECVITTNRTLAGLTHLPLTWLSFGYSDGIFGTVLSRGVLPTISSLEQLDLSYCRISVIEKDVFANFPRLQKLILSGNPLGPKDLVFLSHPNYYMESLSLIDTSIISDSDYYYDASNYLCTFPNLKAMLFGESKMNRPPIFSNTTLCNFTTSTKVRELSLRDSRLDHVAGPNNDETDNPCLTFPYLQTLELQNNLLKNVKGLEMCHHLETLKLSSNQLNLGQTRNESSLASIFRSLTKMKDLALETNQFRSIESDLIANMTELRFFRFRENALAMIDSNFFKNNRKLVFIDFSYNYLQFLDADLFANLTHLSTLLLNDNKFLTLSPTFLSNMDQLPRLKNFEIEQNPFDCDCDKKHFRDWLQNHIRLEASFIQDIKCSTPPRLNGSYVYGYEDDLFDCWIKPILIYGGTAVAGFLITLAIALPCYKYRWYVKNARLLWRAFKGGLDSVRLEQKYPYDAYVSFDPNNEADATWVVEELVSTIESCPEKCDAATQGTCKHKRLQLYLEHRDSLGGTNRFTEREIALQKSKRIIIVVSCSYLKSAGCLGEADLSGLQMHGTEFYQPNRVLLLIREDLSEEIIRPPMSSLLLGRTLKVEQGERRMNKMWSEVTEFLSKPLYIYCKPDEAGSVSESPIDEDAEQSAEDGSDTAPLLSVQA